jgi:hypothetical protein
MGASNGNGSDDRDRHHDDDAPGRLDDAHILALAQPHFDKLGTEMRELLDQQIALFKQVMDMTSAATRDAFALTERASTLVLGHLERHDREIAAIKERLAASEARQGAAPGEPPR